MLIFNKLTQIKMYYLIYIYIYIYIYRLKITLVYNSYYKYNIINYYII